MDATVTLVTDPTYHSAFFNQLVYHGAHHQLKVGIAPSFGGDEIEKLRLGHHGNERELGLEAAQISDLNRPHRGGGRHGPHLSVRQLQETVSQPNFVHDFHDRGVEGVAAKVAVEVLVHFEQGNGDALTRQQQREHCSGGPAADNDTSGFVRVLS